MNNTKTMYSEWHGLAHEKCLPPAPVMQVVMLDGGIKLTK